MEIESVADRTGEKAVFEKATILLVEDETFVRAVTTEVLRAAGYRVLSAKDATEGQSLYRRHEEPIDLLLTDIILPGEDGRVLARRLKQRNAALRVLFVTGYGEQIRLLQEDWAPSLAKPFSSTALLERVRQVLEVRPDTPERYSCPLSVADSLENLDWNLRKRNHPAENA